MSNVFILFVLIFVESGATTPSPVLGSTSSSKEELDAENEMAVQAEFSQELMPTEVLVRLSSNAKEASKERPLFVVRQFFLLQNNYAM